MEKLSDQERPIIEMFYQGYKGREIAKALQIPEGTVKSRKSNAIKKMKRKAKALEKDGKLDLHGFSFPVFFNNAVLLRRIYQSLGWLPAAEKLNPDTNTFLAEQYSAGKSNSHKLLRTANPSRHAAWKTALTAVISLSVITGIILSIVLPPAFKTATLTCHYKNGPTYTFTQSFDKSTGLLTSNGPSMSALANLINWRDFEKNGVLMSLVINPYRTMKDHFTYTNSFFDYDLYNNFFYAVFAYSPWIKNGKIRRIRVYDSKSIILNCRFQVKNHLVQTCEFFGSQGKPESYIKYYYNAHGNLTRITSLNTNPEITLVSVSYNEKEQAKAVNIYHTPMEIYFVPDGTIQFSLNPKYNKNGQVIESVFDTKYLASNLLYKLMFQYKKGHLDKIIMLHKDDLDSPHNIVFSHGRLASWQTEETNSNFWPDDLHPAQVPCTYTWEYD